MEFHIYSFSMISLLNAPSFQKIIIKKTYFFFFFSNCQLFKLNWDLSLLALTHTTEFTYSSLDASAFWWRMRPNKTSSLFHAVALVALHAIWLQHMRTLLDEETNASWWTEATVWTGNVFFPSYILSVQTKASWNKCETHYLSFIERENGARKNLGFPGQLLSWPNVDHLKTDYVCSLLFCLTPIFIFPI